MMAATVFEMGSIFRRLPHLDGGGGGFSSSMKDGVFGGRDDADVEGHLPAVDPTFEADVTGAR